jgi:hypothetical protein
MLQTLPVTGLDQGHRYYFVISNAASEVTVEFKHAGDPTWRTLPDAGGVPDGTVVAFELLVFTPEMRLVFASAPIANYYFSAVCAASATF